MVTLRSYQQDILTHLQTLPAHKQFVLVQSATGCHAAGTPIMLASGSLRAVEKIRLGDKLMGPDGKARTVLALYRGFDQLYEIIPRLGPTFVVNAKHILCLKDKRNKIRCMSVREYLSLPERRRAKFRLWRASDTLVPDIYTPANLPNQSQFTIIEAGIDFFYGFELDGDHLYVTYDRTVHHNSGKTVMFSELVKHYSQQNANCLILVHRALLVQQAFASLERTLADTPHNLRCLCSSLGKPSPQAQQTTAPQIVVATPQSLHTRLDELQGIDLVIIDECHRVPPKDQPSLYATILNDIVAKNPHCRVIGVTASPWRLDQGNIYGQANSWWDSLDYKLSIADLQKENWLAPLSVKVATNAYAKALQDSTDIPPVNYKAIQMGSAVQAVLDEAKDRNHIIVFCSTIAHAHKLCAEFREHNISAATIDSATDSTETMRSLQDFAQGKIRVLCSVGMLTEGWDCPLVDCLVLCRRTLSTALYVQMIGRGLRLAPGKKDCLLLDLSRNTLLHGSPNAPYIANTQHTPSSSTPNNEQEKTSVKKACPHCGCEVSTRTQCCPCCQHILVGLDNERKQFHTLDFDELEGFGQKDLLLQPQRKQGVRIKIPANTFVLFTLLHAHLVQPKAKSPQSSSAPANILKLFLTVKAQGIISSFSLVLDPENACYARNGNSLAWEKTRTFWQLCGKGSMPQTCAEMVQRWQEVTLPPFVWVKKEPLGLRPIWKCF